jgi:S1-C subfamily serine protease
LVTDIGNGKIYTATVAGYDAAQDVAVLQLQGASGLTTARPGDSATVQTGDKVVALGNAGGKGGTPSAGLFDPDQRSPVDRGADRSGHHIG